MSKTIMPSFNGSISQKLLKQQYRRMTAKKSPKVFLIKPVFKKTAIRISKINTTRNSAK